MIEKKIEERPWGKFEQFTQNESTTVKIISVRKGEELSLQFHDHRKEFWRIITGTPIVTVGTMKIPAKPGSEFFVEAKAPHRIEAAHDDVIFLEIAYGDFDEKDITRIEDRYGRV